MRGKDKKRKREGGKRNDREGAGVEEKTERPSLKVAKSDNGKVMAVTATIGDSVTSRTTMLTIL